MSDGFFSLEKCSVWQTLSMKYNVFVLLSLFNKMSDWVWWWWSTKRSRSSFSHFPPGPMRFHVRRKFSIGKTKGFDIFNYLNYFWSQILIVLSDGFFLSRNAVSGNFW